MTCEGERERRVVPEHVAIDVIVAKQLINQRPLRGDGVATRSEMRNRYPHARLVLHDLKPRHRRVDDRLLDEEHTARSRESRQQMLRPLEHEVPPEMREAHDRFSAVRDPRLRAEVPCRTAVHAYGISTSVPAPAGRRA